MRKKLLWTLLVAAMAALSIWLWGRETSSSFVDEGAPAEGLGGCDEAPSRVAANVKPKKSAKRKPDVRAVEVSAAVENAGEGAARPMTEEEKREAAEEKRVEAFDTETDRWMDAEKTKRPTMNEVEKFHALFKALPKDRKEECLHRALNLVPDENVMLLAGILMDKTEDKELVELVFNDVLNRGEDVKKPILREVFKDKTHPCWADTAWIFDVTGEMPGKQATSR